MKGSVRMLTLDKESKKFRDVMENVENAIAKAISEMADKPLGKEFELHYTFSQETLLLMSKEQDI